MREIVPAGGAAERRVHLSGSEDTEGTWVHRLWSYKGADPIRELWI